MGIRMMTKVEMTQRMAFIMRSWTLRFRLSRAWASFFFLRWSLVFCWRRARSRSIEPAAVAGSWATTAEVSPRMLCFEFIAVSLADWLRMRPRF